METMLALATLHSGKFAYYVFLLDLLHK